MTCESDPASFLLRRRKSAVVFTWMVAISFLLHLAVSIIFVLPGRYQGETARPVFVDLAEMPDKVLPQPSAQAPETPLPDVPAMPAPEDAAAAPETEKQEVIQPPPEQTAAKTEKTGDSSIGLGMTAGYFGSFAKGESLRPEIREYYFSLMGRINEVWWKNPAIGPRLGRSAAISILMTREGKIESIHFIESSGDADYDRLLLETLKKAEPLPPPPPDFMKRTFAVPVRFIPPLDLRLPQFIRKPSEPNNGNW